MEQAEAEQKLADLRARLSQIAENNKLGSWLTDRAASMLLLEYIGDEETSRLYKSIVAKPRY